MRRRERLRIIERSRETAASHRAASQNKTTNNDDNSTASNTNTNIGSEDVKDVSAVVTKSSAPKQSSPSTTSSSSYVQLSSMTKPTYYDGHYRGHFDDGNIEEKKEDEVELDSQMLKNKQGDEHYPPSDPGLDSSCREDGAYELVLTPPQSEVSQATSIQVTVNNSRNETATKTNERTSVVKGMLTGMFQNTVNDGQVVTVRNENPLKKSRSLISPLARMRDSTVQEEAVLSDDGHSPQSKTVKSTEEVKREKSKKWKKHMKRAQKQKMREKKTLEAGHSHNNKTPGQRLVNLVLDDFEQTRFFDLFRTQCGTYIDSDVDSIGEEASTDTGDDDDDSEASSQSAIGNCGLRDPSSDSTRRRRLRRRTSKGSSKSSENKSKRRPESSHDDNDEQQMDGEYSPSRSSSRTPSDTYTLSTRTFSTQTSAQAQQASKTPIETQDSRRIADGYASAGSHGQEEQEKTTSHSNPVASRQNVAIPPHQGAEPPSQHSLRMPANWSNPTRTSTPLSPLLPSAAVGGKSTLDKLYVKTFITDAVANGFSMLWHKEQASMNPAPVTIRLKPGHYQSSGLSSSHCGPRVVWSDQSNDRYGVNLFHVLSIDRAKPDHLKDFPFAIPGRSVCLKLKDDQYFVFEANSEDEAWRFVHGLRWVIARLTFNLVIGNVDVSCELLDARTMKTYGAAKPSSLFQEFEQTKAMDDLAEQMVSSLAAAAVARGRSYS